MEITSHLTRLQRLKQRPFIRDAAVLQIGSLVNTALGFVSSVVLARTLGPSAYGTYALVFSFAALMVTLTDWSGAAFVMNTFFSKAYAERNETDLRALLVYYIKMFCAVFLPLALLAFLIAPDVAALMYRNRTIGELSRYVLLAGIFGSYLAMVKILLESSRKVKRLTMIEATERAVFFLFPLLLVILGFGVSGAVAGYFLASVLLLAMSWFVYRELTRRDPLFPSMRSVLRLAGSVSIRRFFSFGILASVDKTFAAISSGIPMVIAGMFVQTADLGFYKIAFSYVTLSAIILKPVGRLLNVQLPKSLTFGIATLRRDFYRVTFVTTFFAVVCAVPLLLAAPFLVHFFYGQHYAPVVVYIRIMILYGIISATGYGIGAMFRTLNKIPVAIVINAVNVALAVPVLWTVVHRFGINGMMWFIVCDFAAIMAVSHLYFFRYFMKNIHAEAAS